MSLEIYDIRDKIQYLREVMILEHNEWAKEPQREFNERVNYKISKAITLLNEKNFCKLILLESDCLIGFISLFPQDCEEHPELTPWYATMYVKKEYRGKGYSKLLNDAILKESKKRGFKNIYLKTDLINYYEKFGATYISELQKGEKLYKFEL